ncbi:MAG: ImmA/IrrE family metallo-endopeptidase [Candidatus Xenobia bacterium]
MTELLEVAASYGPMPPVPVERLASDHLYLLIEEADEPAHHHPDARVKQHGRLLGLLLPEAREIYLKRSHVRHPQERRRTIAHEIGHYKRHYHPGGSTLYTCQLDDLALQESEADAFADELLMPEALVVHHARNLCGNVIRLATLFEVPRPVMAARLRALGLWSYPWRSR